MVQAHIPGIEYAAMPRAGMVTGALSWPTLWIIIHDTSNRQSDRYSEAHYAATRTDAQANWTSAHAYVDRGGVLGSLPLDLRAWAAYSDANAHGVHIELCLEPDGSIHPDTVRNAAALVRTLLSLGAAGGRAVKLGPADVAAHRAGICGHRDITLGLRVGDHQDPEEPGTRFDWAAFMALITTSGAAPAAGEDDDTMSYKEHIELKPDTTSIPLAIVQGGGGDPRRCWAHFSVDTRSAEKVGLRAVVYAPDTSGAYDWREPGWSGGGTGTGSLRAFVTGERAWFELPKGATLLSIQRKPVNAAGQVIEKPTADDPKPYAGDLRVCLEWGALVK